MSLVVWDSSSVKTFSLAAVGGLTDAIVGHPLDSIKVRLQTNATKHILRQLYRGLLPPLIASPTAWILNFSLYQHALTVFKSEHLLNVFFAGGVAGTCWSSIICPFDAVKCYAQRYRVTSATAFNDIRSQLGVIGMYRGLTSCLIRDVPMSAAYFLILETCRQRIPNYDNSMFVFPFLNGSMCGIGSWLVGLPGDCIKSQIQTNFAPPGMKSQFNQINEKILSEQMSTGFIINSRRFVNENGWNGLYRGLLPVMFRQVLTSGCCVVAVEHVNRTFFTES